MLSGVVLIVNFLKVLEMPTLMIWSLMMSDSAEMAIVLDMVMKVLIVVMFVISTTTPNGRVYEELRIIKTRYYDQKRFN